MIELPYGLANMAGQGNHPGGAAFPKPVNQLIDHGREATQLLQIPESMVGGDQRLEVKRRYQ